MWLWPPEAQDPAVPTTSRQALRPGSLHKPLDQPHPPGDRQQKQENYNPPAYGNESTKTGQKLP